MNEIRNISNLKWKIYSYSELGLIFIPLSLIFYIGLFFNLQSFDFREIIYLNEKSPTIKGLITQINDTGKLNEKAYYYEFKIAKDNYSGLSYCSDNFYLKTDNEIIIQYNSKRPEINRVKGMTNTSNEFNFGITILLLFFCLLPIFLFVIGIKKGNKLYRLTKYGIKTQGFLDIINQKEYESKDKYFPEIRYKFLIKGETFKTKIYSKSNWTDINPSNIESTNTVLYDKNDPKRSIILNDLPKKVRLEINKKTNPDST